MLGLDPGPKIILAWALQVLDEEKVAQENHGSDRSRLQSHSNHFLLWDWGSHTLTGQVSKSVEWSPESFNGFDCGIQGGLVDGKGFLNWGISRGYLGKEAFLQP